MKFKEELYQIKDLAEMNFHTTVVEVRIVCRIVNQLTKLPLAHLGGPISEYKE